MKNSHLIRSSWLVVVLGFVTLCLPRTAVTAGPLVRTVAGEVEAVNLTTSPQVIVVKVILPTKEDMIVGATVGPDVPITRGKKRTSLAEIKTGDHIRITYEKHLDGIAAKAIHAR